MKKLFGNILAKSTFSKKEDLGNSNSDEEQKQGAPKEFPQLHTNHEHLHPEEGMIDQNTQSTKDKESTSDETNQREHRLEEIKRSMYERKCKKFEKVLQLKVIELDQLRALAWNGCPQHVGAVRCTTWKLLLDYIPNDQEIQMETIARKREEYTDMVEHYFGSIMFDSLQDLFKKREMSQYEQKSIK